MEQTGDASVEVQNTNMSREAQTVMKLFRYLDDQNNAQPCTGQFIGTIWNQILLEKETAILEEDKISQKEAVRRYFTAEVVRVWACLDKSDTSILESYLKLNDEALKIKLEEQLFELKANILAMEQQALQQFDINCVEDEQNDSEPTASFWAKSKVFLGKKFQLT